VVVNGLVLDDVCEVFGVDGCGVYDYCELFDV